MKTVAMVGGGSGGHITPILAVADALKKQAPDARIVYIGQTGDKLADIPKEHPAITQAVSVTAGKLRRYHGAGFRQVLDISTTFKNCIDMFKVMIGIVQSYRLLGRIRPDMIFIKGGFVGVPVGIAARMRHIPYVTHDSDSTPGLANRIISRWAVAHAVGMPKELYAYPADKTHYVGVPVSSAYQPVNRDQQAVFKQQLGMPKSTEYLFVTGGGLGAKRINNAMLDIIPKLLHEMPELRVGIAAGRGNEQGLKAALDKTIRPEDLPRIQVYAYITDMHVQTGAADLVVSRAGATALAELAAQGRAVVVVPHPQLTGGHQLKNAGFLAHRHAVALVTEEDLAQGRATQLILQMLSNKQQRTELAETLQGFSKPEAASDLANLLLTVQ